MEGKVKDLKTLKKHYKGKVFKFSDAMNLGISKADFYTLVKNGKIEKLARGIYQLEEDLFFGLEEQFRAAVAQINTESSICLLSALSYYNLTTSVVLKHNILVDHRYTTRNRNIELFRKRTPHWEVGIEQKEGFKITSVERTIIECVVYKSKTGFEGVQALKASIIENKVKLVDLHEIAKALGYNKKVDQYLEVFI